MAQPKKKVTAQDRDQKKLKAAVEELLGDDSEALLADGFERAAIGVVTYDIAKGHGRVVYDYDACIAILMERDGMTEEDAIEHMEFNVTGAYVGPGTPLFARMLPPKLWSRR